MIQPVTVKAVQELLKDRGVEQRVGERWGDYIARGLAIDEAQAELFLEALDQNKSIEEACTIAGVDPARAAEPQLVELARAIGKALGTIRQAL